MDIAIIDNDVATLKSLEILLRNHLEDAMRKYLK